MSVVELRPLNYLATLSEFGAGGWSVSRSSLREIWGRTATGDLRVFKCCALVSWDTRDAGREVLQADTELQMGVS